MRTDTHRKLCCFAACIRRCKRSKTQAFFSFTIIISGLLPQIMKSALLEKECIVKEEGISSMIEVLNELGHDGSIIRAALKKQYYLSEKETGRHL